MYKIDYTKVSNKLVEKYGIKVAFVYAKLRYRMKLSHDNPKQFFNNGFFEIYKIKDLMKDCHLGKNSIINVLKKLEQIKLIHRERTMFASRIYLPKFEKHNTRPKKQTKESLENKPSKELINQNKDSNNYVYSSPVNVKKAKPKFPTMTQIKKRFNPKLVNYAINHIYQKYISWGFKVYSKSHFIYGVLRRWQRKGLKTLNAVMVSENDKHAKLPNGPEIPIFKI